MPERFFTFVLLRFRMTGPHFIPNTGLTQALALSRQRERGVIVYAAMPIFDLSAAKESLVATLPP